MTIGYNEDIVVWANEQAALIRAGKFALLDLENIAEEIEDVGKSESRELESRMSVLLAHLLKWKFQPKRRGASWEATIKIQRSGVKRALKKTPSLKVQLQDSEWLEATWDDARGIAIKETKLANFPNVCIWTVEEILTDDWLPN